ncbi:uncharacterized protein LOC130985652 [Salvia miltiorrhiza]|uniref:uncharacterized protein LOC130985652 n=1 Tax=Salvia miltiorrhiza TaxID=226208 RepID=UPI0025AB921C|nr:uncharacterized protein LOC130985652 [Salvia miltiorrhiza]
MSQSRGWSTASASGMYNLVDEGGDDDIEVPSGIPSGRMRRSSSVCQGTSGGSGLGVDSEGPILNAIPMASFLSIENPTSDINRAGLVRRIRRKYMIPDWVTLHAPDATLLANYYVENMVCLYEFIFVQGSRLPLPRLVLELCDYHHLSPGQLMPNAWRLLLCIQVFAELHNFDVNVYDVLYSYAVNEHRSTGRFCMKVRPNKDALIASLGDGEKNWASKYIFVNYDSLGVPADMSIPSAWSDGSRVKQDPPVSLGLAERADRFLSFPIAERKWKAILVDDNLRRTSIWDHQAGCGEDRWMSNPKYQVECTNDKSYKGFLERQKQQKKKKKQVVTSSSREVETVSDDVLPLTQIVQKRGKRTAQSSEPAWTDGSVNFSIPADASVHTGYDALFGQLGQLLLDEDRARLAGFSTPSRMARMACGHAMMVC